MRLTDWIGLMDRIAPPELALGFDNVGLLIGTDRKEIRRVLVALDLRVETAREAVAGGYDLVLTHHPVLFQGVKRILPDHADTAALCILLRGGVAHFAAHTNLDAAEGGVNDTLCALLDVCAPLPLPPEGLTRLGTLPEPMRLDAFAARVGQRLGCCAQVLGDASRTVSRVAVTGGAGSSEIELVRQAGADVFVTGECKHSAALAAEAYGLSLIVAGHWETEEIVLRPLIERLQHAGNDVQYKLALSDRSPFWRVQEGTI